MNRRVSRPLPFRLQQPSRYEGDFRDPFFFFERNGEDQRPPTVLRKHKELNIYLERLEPEVGEYQQRGHTDTGLRDKNNPVWEWVKLEWN